MQAGDTGTIPFEPTSKSQADVDALSDKYYPGSAVDTEPGSGDGCRLWYTAGLGTCELDWLAMAAGGRRRVASLGPGPGPGKGKEGMLKYCI